jgi:hypothetical protein
VPSRLQTGSRLFLPLGLFAAAAIVAVVALVLRSSGSPSEPNSAPTRPQSASQATNQQTLPTAARLNAAKVFASRRLGRVSFAVVDTAGVLTCYRCQASYHSASVVKAMLLVAYVNRLADEGEPLPADHEAYLEAMIRASDNDAASAIYMHVGDQGLSALARQAQMVNFEVSDSWGSARITAADQARFFAHMRELTAPAYRDYAQALLASITTAQSWGIPEASRPEWKTTFKGGWLTTRRGSLVHQVARLEKDGMVLAIAVLTDGDPNDAYGRETIRAIASRLLGG